MLLHGTDPLSLGGCATPSTAQVDVRVWHLSGALAAQLCLPAEASISAVGEKLAEVTDRPPRLLHFLAAGCAAALSPTCPLSACSRDGRAELQVVVSQVREVHTSPGGVPPGTMGWAGASRSQLRRDPDARLFTVRRDGQPDVSFAIGRSTQLYYLMKDYCCLNGLMFRDVEFLAAGMGLEADMSVAEYEGLGVFLSDGEFFDCIGSGQGYFI
mmetsp:Transcript_100822/g.314295  ORF Transcript_100822/g.314295 Transcript_100822/m.314295 type:complete len:213 (+) Transcript_100822:28-666(+)